MNNLPPAAVITFIATHTTEDTNLPLLDECPICLDNYTSETCLQITGINGCNHHIGHKCLEEMLRSHPNEEKKCPLCRAVWIPAPAPSLALSRRMQGMFAGLDDIGENIAGTPQLGNRLGLHPRREGAAVLSLVPRPNAPSSMFIDSDTDEEDYATQFQNFQDSTRELADIRQRAQQVQNVRSRIRQNRQDGSNNDNGPRRTLTTGNGSFNRFVNRRTGALNPFRPTQQQEARTIPTYASGEQIDARLEQARDEQRRIAPMRQSHRRDPTTRLNSSLSPPETELLGTPSPEPAARPRRLFSANDTHMQDDDVQELAAQPVLEAVRGRHLNNREVELERREQAVAAREEAMREQEVSLGERQRALVELVAKQRREVEDLGRRQAEELERVLK